MIAEGAEWGNEKPPPKQLYTSYSSKIGMKKSKKLRQKKLRSYYILGSGLEVGWGTEFDIK